MASDIKVVIVLKENRGIVGVQSPDCDPIFSTVEGDLVTIAAELPELVRAAEEKFTAAPRNPPGNLPEPKPAPTPAHTGTARSSTTGSAKGKDASRPSLFQ